MLQKHLHVPRRARRQAPRTVGKTRRDAAAASLCSSTSGAAHSPRISRAAGAHQISRFALVSILVDAAAHTQASEARACSAARMQRHSSERTLSACSGSTRCSSQTSAAVEMRHNDDHCHEETAAGCRALSGGRRRSGVHAGSREPTEHGFPRAEREQRSTRGRAPSRSL